MANDKVNWDETSSTWDDWSVGDGSSSNNDNSWSSDDSWGDNTPQGQTESTQIDWGDPEAQGQDNGQAQEDNSWDGYSDDIGASSSDAEIIAEPVKPQKANIPMKFVGIIIAVICVILAAVFFMVDHIKVKPKENVAETQAVQQTQAQSQTTQQTTVNPDNITMILIPEDTVMNYSGDVLDAQGTVKAKKMYLIDHQVIYDIQISFTAGANTQDVHSLCNYATYQSVAVGDMIFVKYQQVSEGFISVNSISK